MTQQHDKRDDTTGQTGNGQIVHPPKFWTSASERVAADILDLVKRQGLAVGAQLPSQRDLADTLGVSRPTVREALISLEGKGVLDIRPARGVFFRGEPAQTPTPEPAEPAARRPAYQSKAGRAAQMYQFRWAIEPAVAALAALNATTAQLEDLRALLADMQAALNARNLQELGRLDFTFHEQLVEAANNPYFVEAVAPSLDAFFESQTLPFAEGQALSETVEEHRRLLESLAARDADAARSRMSEHILGAARRAGISLPGLMGS